MPAHQAPREDDTERRDDDTERREDDTERRDDDTGPRDDDTERRDDDTEPRDDDTSSAITPLSTAMTPNMDERASVEVRRLGRTRYAEAHALQVELLSQRIDGRVGDVLLLTEHDPVVTLGRKSPLGDASGVDVPIVVVERGGEATFHGPGQVVGYPILFLPEGRRDLHRYLRDLEEVVIRAIGDFGVEGRRKDGFTGVWIGAHKVCSLGVAVRRWVTWHGFALNVTTDPDVFRAFQPCGLDPRVMTRLRDHVDAPLETRDVELRLALRFAEVFGFREIVER